MNGVRGSRTGDMQDQREALLRRCARLRSGIGRTIEIHDLVDSTNDVARVAVDQGASAGHVVVADRQLRGRGSNGRRWSSPPGTDLYLSIAIGRSQVRDNASILALLAGLATAYCVEEFVASPGNVRVKWPNDVRIGLRKCAGAMVERRTIDRSGDLDVLGIGLNVNRQHWPDELAHRATAIWLHRRSKQQLDRAQVLWRLLAQLDRVLNALDRDGPTALLGELESRLAWRGCQVRCGGNEGILVGLSSDGGLSIAGPKGCANVVHGTLELQLSSEAAPAMADSL